MADSTNQFLVNVEVAIVRGDEYLMIVRGDDEEFGAGWLGMPGGKVDWNEPLADVLEHTARREVMEEVGLLLDEPIHYVE
ncbi:MAG: NUDIX domain-containing protein, partial [Thermomicrobiales bacterium]